MMHAILIIIHASIAFIAFFLGILAVRPPRNPDLPLLYRSYLIALWLMVLSLIVVVSVDWIHLAKESRMIFTALSLFAIFIAWRGTKAADQLRNRTDSWELAYIDKVGFTIISLFVGFSIIFVLESGGPVWEGVVVGVLAVLAGRMAISAYKKKFQ